MSVIIEIFTELGSKPNTVKLKEFAEGKYFFCRSDSCSTCPAQTTCFNYSSIDYPHLEGKDLEIIKENYPEYFI